jgi:CubicO group peptidase (beta-lactamase class C family)
MTCWHEQTRQPSMTYRLPTPLGLAFVLLARATALEPPNAVFPADQWLEAPPESQGINGTLLNEAAAHLAQAAGADGTRELVIIRHGRLIWKGDNIDKRHGVWSATKSFTSTVLGLLVADGKCTLDTRVADVLPDLKKQYPDVTLRHLTTMTSGYRAVGDETTGNYKHGPSKTPFKPHPQPLFTPPGSQFAYWDSAMNLFGLALTKIAGEPIESLFKRRIADPIGMRQWDWGDYTTINGVVVNGGSGNSAKHVSITARAMARFGWLFLNKGNWNGQQLIPASWVADATQAHVPNTMPWAHPESGFDGRGVYGFNWWVNGVKPDGTRKLPAAPEGTFWASGHNNNQCFVIPAWDMVVVRLGLDGNVKDEVWNAFFAEVGDAVITPE